MKILASSPNVISDNQYPFENRYLTYLCKIAKIIDSPPSENWNNTNLININDRTLGPLPYKNISIFNKKTLSDKLSINLVSTFLKELYHTHKPKNEINLFYPEKIPPWNAKYIEKHIRCKNIFMIRDPRDIFVSIKSFNEKRGFLSFGWQISDTEEAFALKLCKQFKNYYEWFINTTNKKDSLHVKYEDLVSNNKKEVDRISKWLEIKINYSQKENLESRHISTKNGTPQTERWVKELPHKILNIINNELENEIKTLGYRFQ